MSVDVDFAALRDVAESGFKDKVNFFGTVTQREFLARMGIMERFEQLYAQAKLPKEKAVLEKGLIRLMDPTSGMGQAYKVAAVVGSELEGPPAGFA